MKRYWSAGISFQSIGNDSMGKSACLWFVVQFLAQILDLDLDQVDNFIHGRVKNAGDFLTGVIPYLGQTMATIATSGQGWLLVPVERDGPSLDPSPVCLSGSRGHRLNGG